MPDELVNQINVKAVLAFHQYFFYYYLLLVAVFEQMGIQ